MTRISFCGYIQLLRQKIDIGCVYCSGNTYVSATGSDVSVNMSLYVSSADDWLDTARLLIREQSG